MSEKKIIGYIVLPNGKKKEVFGERGRYWVCKDAQFRKAAFELIPCEKKEKPKKKQEKEAEEDAV